MNLQTTHYHCHQSQCQKAAKQILPWYYALVFGILLGYLLSLCQQAAQAAQREKVYNITVCDEN